MSMAFDNDEQLAAATVFLQRSSPLQHVAKEKKSQVSGSSALCLDPESLFK